MVDDVKSLTKKCADLEKRLKFAEAKIKVIADAMTSSKDIEKYLDVLQSKMDKDMRKGIEVSEKAQMRENSVAQKAIEAYSKESEKEYQRQHKESDKLHKEMEKLSKDSVRQSLFDMMMVRLGTLEALVAGIRR